MWYAASILAWYVPCIDQAEGRSTLVAAIAAGAVATFVTPVRLAVLLRGCNLRARLGHRLGLLLTRRAGALTLLDELQGRGLRLGLLALLGGPVA